MSKAEFDGDLFERAEGPELYRRAKLMDEEIVSHTMHSPDCKCYLCAIVRTATYAATRKALEAVACEVMQRAAKASERGQVDVMNELVALARYIDGKAEPDETTC